MSRIKNAIALSSFMLIFLGCSTQITKPDLEIIEPSNTKEVFVFDIERYTNLKSSFIKLETLEECLIGNIIDIQYSDNKLFILNSIAGESELLIFDQIGRFLNKIGTLGAGPGEYLSISAFGVNSYNKYVILMDPLRKMIHKYEYSGKYIDSKKTKAESAFICKIRYNSKDKIRCVQSINSNSSTLVSESDEDLGRMKVLWKTSFHFNGGYSFAQNPVSYTGMYFILPLSDIIYKYSEGNLKPAYKVFIDSKYQPDDDNSKGGDFSEVFGASIGKGLNPLNRIAENGDLLLIQKFKSIILWDKKAGKGFIFKDANSYPTDDCIPITSYTSIYGSEIGFIAVFSASDLLKVSDYYEKEKIQPNSKIQKAINKLTIDENPTLCIYGY